MTPTSGNASNSKGFLPYELGYLTPEMEEIAKTKFGETEEIRNRCMEELRDLLRNEKNLYVRIDDNWILMFLRGRNFDVQQAFKCIQNFYGVRKEYSYIFDNENNEPIHDVFRKNFLGFLPYRDTEGRVIAVVKAGLWNPYEVSRDLIFWTVVHLTMFSIEDPATQVLGYIVLIDLRGCGLRHIRMCTLENILLVRHTILNCFPGRNFKVHFIGLPAVFTMGYKILYPFIPHELKKQEYYQLASVLSQLSTAPATICWTFNDL